MLKLSTDCTLSFVQSVAKDHAPTSGEFFRLLARLVGQMLQPRVKYSVLSVCSPRLLNHAQLASVQIAGLDKLLEEELKWLLKVRVSAANKMFFFGIIV